MTKRTGNKIWIKGIKTFKNILLKIEIHKDFRWIINLILIEEMMVINLLIKIMILKRETLIDVQMTTVCSTKGLTTKQLTTIKSQVKLIAMISKMICRGRTAMINSIDMVVLDIVVVMNIKGK